MGSRKAPRPAGRPGLASLAAILVGILAFLLARDAGELPNFNPDESRWISRAHYLADLADPASPTWQDQYMTRGQPPLGSYVMGFGLVLQGRDLETNPPWDFSIPWEENIAAGHKPVAADLQAGRRTSAVLVAATAVVLIAVAATFVAPPWAVLAGLVFAVHPFNSYIGSMAVSDALFGFLIALAALAAAAFASRPTWWRAIGLGALLGLGGATKLSPLLVAVGLSAGAVLLLMLMRLRGQPDEAQRRQAWQGVMIGVAALVTFVAVYPYLWSNPIGHTANLFTFRVEEMAAQAADWPVMAVPNRAEALRRVGANFTERYNLLGGIAASVHAPAPLLVRSVEVVLAGLGVLVMGVTALRAGPYSARFLAFAVMAGQVAVTILGMRSEFDRYHVPAAVLGAVAIAVAVEWLARLAGRWLTMRPQARLARS